MMYIIRNTPTNLGVILVTVLWILLVVVAVLVLYVWRTYNTMVRSRNLVDEGWDPHFHNAEVLEAIADPDFQTELAQYNIELNVRPRPLPGDEALHLEQDLRDSLNQADARAREVGSRILAIGMLPTIMPEHYQGEWISNNNRYTALNDSIFVARGEDIFLDIEGPTGERVATYCDSIAPDSG